MGYVQDIMLPGKSQGLLQGLSCGLPRAPCTEQGSTEQPQAHATELLGSRMTHKTKTCISSVPLLWVMMMMWPRTQCHACFLVRDSVSFSFPLTPYPEEAREGVVFLCVLLYHTFNTPRLLHWKSHGITIFTGKAYFLLFKKSSR